eukprot:scaffold43573_cov60-Phaeocystis_antarctica.AAC.1
MRHGAKRPECSRRAQQSVSAAAHDEAVDEAARENASRGAITASPFIDHGIDEHHSITGGVPCSQ